MGQVKNEVGPLTSQTRLFKSHGFDSGGVGAGTFYASGFYFSPAADANLTQAVTSITLGAANVPYAAHVFVVAGGAGSVDAGSVALEVTGTSINDAGVRTTTDTETIIADITGVVADQMLETSKKWIGQVTIQFNNSGAAVFSLDFNYGFAKYDDFGNRNFTLTDFELTGLAGQNDAGFEIELLHHKGTGWTYDAAAFVPGAAALLSMGTIHSTENDLDVSEPFAFKRSGLNQSVLGAASEGLIIRITTTAVGTLDHCDFHVGARVAE